MRFLFDRPLSRTRAWTCVLTNLAATPGLGSLMGRRFFAGTGQLILALAGFFLMLGWMLKLLYRIFQEQLGGAVPQNSSGWMLKWGLIVFGAGWLWSLVTSVSLLWEAKMDERKNHQNVPPQLANPKITRLVMYKIIGADGREYGPISAEEIRRWFAVNRVNAQTLVQSEGASEWKPLGAFPELISETGAVPPTIAPPQSSIASRASNKIAAGICGILLGGLGVHKFILGYAGAGGIMLAVTLCSLLTCGLLWPAYVVIHIIGLIEGIIYLTKSDEEFVRIYVDGRKEWF